MLTARFFYSVLRKKRGHLICYVSKHNKFDQLAVKTVEDSNYIYSELHLILEIDINTGKYVGPYDSNWLRHLQCLLKNFTIREVNLINTEHPDHKMIWEDPIMAIISRGSFILLQKFCNLHPVNIKKIVVHQQPLNLVKMKKSIYTGYRKCQLNLLMSFIYNNPQIEEIEMKHSPGFYRLDRRNIINRGSRISNGIQQLLDNPHMSTISNRLAFKYFIDYRCVNNVIRVLPNVTELYYLVTWDGMRLSFDTKELIEKTIHSLQQLVFNLDHLKQITIFTDESSVVTSVIESFRDSRVKIVIF